VTYASGGGRDFRNNRYRVGIRLRRVALGQFTLSMTFRDRKGRKTAAPQYAVTIQPK